ncbi:hypothetical protein LJC59_07455, partial [Desulfovibrio sp. OttesenSCG-928-A18]|nr:hypothetical protein [Desulfovibrio sp. OttesenSCG-928-A18]
LALLFDSGGKDKSEKKALREVKRLKDQAGLMEIAKTAQYSSVRVAAIGKLTDPARIAELAKGSRYAFELKASMATIADQEILLDIAKNATADEVSLLAVERLMNLGETTGIDEREWVAIIRSLESNIIDAKFSPVMKRFFSKICTPSVLLEYTPPVHSNLFNGCYLSRVIELADGNPDVFRQFQSKATAIIRESHTDTMGPPKKVHADHKQRVRGTSSDCHNDSIPWKPAMTGFGHGYHQDGYIVLEPRHSDSVYFNKFKPYFEEHE